MFCGYSFIDKSDECVELTFEKSQQEWFTFKNNAKNNAETENEMTFLLLLCYCKEKKISKDNMPK